jgi:hypothetical protein
MSIFTSLQTISVTNIRGVAGTPHTTLEHKKKGLGGTFCHCFLMNDWV